MATSANDNYDPDKEKAQHEAAAGAGVTAGTGLGCLAISTLPWSILVVIFLIIVVAWFLKSHYTG